MDVAAEYRIHGPTLVRFATALVGPDGAPDVVSDVITATLARGSLDGVSEVRAYWLRAVANTAASRHRSDARRDRRERVAAATRATSAAASGSPDDLDDPFHARSILDELSVQQRAVVVLTYWLDWPPTQVAATLDVSEGAVRKQLARARARLREVVNDDLA